MRKRMAGQLLLVTVAVVVVLGMASMLYDVQSTGQSLLTHPMILVVGLLWLVGVGMIVRQFVVDLRVARLVPRNDALMCPSCRTVLPRVDSGHCPRCGKPFSKTQLREFWEQYALAPLSPRRWGANFNIGLGSQSVHKPSVRRRILFGIVFLVIGAGAVFWSARFSGTSLPSAIISMGPFLLFGYCCGTGMQLITFVYQMRHGTARYCAECEYRQPPEGEVSQKCSECGASWLEPGGTVHGERVPVPWSSLVASGLAIAWIVMMLLSPMTRLSAGQWLLRFVPNSALIHDAVHARGFTRDTWGELTRRSLTPDEELALAEGLLDRRKENCYLDSSSGRWLAARLKGDTLSQETVDRFFREMLRIWIEAPDEARNGEPLRVWIGSEYCRSSLPVGTDEYLYVGSFAFGEPATLVQCNDQSTYAGLLDDPEYQVSAEFVPRTVGPLVIKLRAWFIVAPTLSRASVTWQLDGCPTLPANIDWMQEFNITRTIIVRE